MVVLEKNEVEGAGTRGLVLGETMQDDEVRPVSSGPASSSAVAPWPLPSASLL